MISARMQMSINVLHGNPHVVNRLQADLMARRCIPARQLDDQRGMSREDLERLRALGYVGD